jgi:hypothetical protein
MGRLQPDTSTQPHYRDATDQSTPSSAFRGLNYVTKLQVAARAQWDIRKPVEQDKCAKLNGEATGENWDVKAVTQVKIRDLVRIKIGRLGEEGGEERR